MRNKLTIILLLTMGAYFFLQPNRQNIPIEKHPLYKKKISKKNNSSPLIQKKEVEAIMEDPSYDVEEELSYEDQEEDDWTTYEGEVHANLFLEDYTDFSKNFKDEVEDEDLVYCDAQVDKCIPQNIYLELIELEAETLSIKESQPYEESLKAKKSYYISCLARAKHCPTMVYSVKIPDDAPELPFYYEGVRENYDGLMDYESNKLKALLDK